MGNHEESLADIREIKRMMERSSRFISLSGLSGIAAGCFGLISAFIAHLWISQYYDLYNGRGGYSGSDLEQLKWKLFFLAIITMACAFLSGFYFTWKKARRNNAVIWNKSSQRLFVNLCIPLLSGGIFVIAMLLESDWKFTGPACLLFYGLALINGSKYTLDEIRYLGMMEIILGCFNLFFTGYGLYFWAAGFGVLHIVYGVVMWNKYERAKPAQPEQQ